MPIHRLNRCNWHRMQTIRVCVSVANAFVFCKFAYICIIDTIVLNASQIIKGYGALVILETESDGGHPRGGGAQGQT